MWDPENLLSSFSGFTWQEQSQTRKCPHKNEWENASQTPAIFEKHCSGYRQNIIMYWVIGDIAKRGHAIYISVQWKMRAPEQEKKQVPTSLLQKRRFKINIAVYGGVAGVLVAVGLLQPKL